MELYEEFTENSKSTAQRITQHNYNTASTKGFGITIQLSSWNQNKMIGLNINKKRPHTGTSRGSSWKKGFSCRIYFLKVKEKPG